MAGFMEGSAACTEPGTVISQQYGCTQHFTVFLFLHLRREAGDGIYLEGKHAAL